MPARLDPNRHLLIFKARLLRRGIEELALVVMDVFDDAIDRVTVHVHVEDVHEYGQPDRTALNETRLVDLRDHDQLSICRRNHQRGTTVADALWVAEEVGDPQRQQKQNERGKPESPRAPTDCETEG